MAAAPTVRGLRGATTVDEDTVAQVTERSQELMRELMASNDLVEDDIISVLFTTTGDVTSTFPATSPAKWAMSTMKVAPTSWAISARVAPRSAARRVAVWTT